MANANSALQSSFRGQRDLTRVLRQRSVPLLLILLLAFGVYTNLPLIASGLAIPMFSAIPIAVIIVAIFWREFISKRLVWIILFSILVGSFSLLSPELTTYMPQRLLGWGQLLYSMILGLVVYTLTKNYSREAIGRFFLLAGIFGLFLCIIEVYSPLKDLVRSYSLLYGSEGITDSVLRRDSAMGGYRPKLFTSETSYVAMALSYCIAIYTWSSKGTIKYLIAVSILLFSFLIVRSPTVLGAFAPIVAVFVTEFIRSPRVRTASFWMFPIILYAGIILFIINGDQISAVINQRLEGAQSGRDYSVTYRTYGSWAAGIAVANKYPLFGAGIASYDLVKDVIISTELSFGVPRSAVEAEWRMSLNNAPSNSLVVFGYLGSALLWVVALFGLKRLAGSLSLPLLALITILAMSDGAIYSPRFVVYIFLFSAVGNRVATLRTGLREQEDGISRPAYVTNTG